MFSSDVHRMIGDEVCRLSELIVVDEMTLVFPLQWEGQTPWQSLICKCSTSGAFKDVGRQCNLLLSEEMSCILPELTKFLGDIVASSEAKYTR